MKRYQLAYMITSGRGYVLFDQGENILLVFNLRYKLMQMADVLTAISTVGFPIVFCILLFWYLREETNNHKEEVTELKTVISENNTILASLKQLIEDKLK